MVSALAVVLALGACGGDDGDEDAATGSEAVEGGAATDGGEEAPADGTSTDGAGDPAEGGGGGGTVAIEGFAFEPASVEAVGGVVAWTNQDGELHTVTAGEPGAPDGPFDQPVDPGATVEVTFEEAGTFAYFCAIHPSMTGEVVVP